MGSEFDLISRDAQRALEEFSQEYALALVASPVEEWAKASGLHITSGALKTTFPIPVDAAGYRELKGDIKYRKLSQKSISLMPRTWQDGVDELASVIEAPDFIGWTSAPAAMATASKSLLNEIVAGLLEANAVQDFDGKAFFANDHPFNIFESADGTFDNLLAGAFSAATLREAKAHFRAMKAPGGKPAGLRMTHALFPSAMEEDVKDVLEQDMVIQAIGSNFGAVDNRHKGTIIPIFSDELTDDDNWYPLALNKPGMVPWMTLDQGAPEELRNDKTSGYYKQTLKVSLAYVLRAEGGLVLPQCIAKFVV